MDNKNNDFIIIKYEGEVTDHSNRLLESSIVYQLSMREGASDCSVLISLKDAKYKDNLKNLVVMVRHIDRLSKKIQTSISLVDYSLEIYPVLKKASEGSVVRLFKNMNVANLFIDSKAYKKEITVLIFDEDEDNRVKLSNELSKYGYTTIKAKNANEFHTCKNEAKHDIIITHSSLNMDYSSSKSSKILTLSKKLILNLPVFMDTAVETLVSFTGLEAEKSAHSVKNFDTELDKDVICAVMHFKGDIEGYFTLLFPKDLAIMAMETLLGESISENDLENLKDGVAEFCNIITGSTKSAFINKDIKILFDLPKTFTSLHATNEYIGPNNGVWIDMQLAGKPFYMFITN